MGGPMDFIKRLGYDRRVGPLGSLTYDDPSTNVPLAVPVNFPSMPGILRKPAGRDLTPEEVAHEGSHVAGGLPMSMLGTVASKVMGLGGTAGYTSPDEAIAYLSQPDSPATRADMDTIRGVASNPGDSPNVLGRGYLALLKKLAEMRGTPQPAAAPPPLAHPDQPWLDVNPHPEYTQPTQQAPAPPPTPTPAPVDEEPTGEEALSRALLKKRQNEKMVKGIRGSGWQDQTQ